MRGGRLHGGRRVPLRRAATRRSRPPRRRSRRASAFVSSTSPTAAAGSPRFRQELGRRSTSTPSRARRGGCPGRRCPPLRPCLSGGLAAGDRGATPRVSGSSCTSTPTSSPARSRNASPSTACARSSCSRRRGCLGPRTTIVHATHASDGGARPARRRGRAESASARRRRRTSETASRPSRAFSSAASALSIGSDSNVRIDPLEELRELEGIARRQELRRNVTCPVEDLLAHRLGGRARARSGSTNRDGVEIELAHRSLAGVSPDEVPAGARLRLRGDVVASDR